MGHSNQAQLAFASQPGRALYTNDTDFLDLGKRMQHAGIAFAPQQLPIGKIVKGLVKVAQTLTTEEMADRFEFI